MAQTLSVILSFSLLLTFTAQSCLAIEFSRKLPKQCQLLLDREPITFPQAIRPSQIDESGVIHYAVHSGYRERKLSLPSIIHALRELPEEKILIITPGNTFYEGTHHNLGFHFADSLIENLSFQGLSTEGKVAGDYPKEESFQISYDDDTARSGSMTFYSEETLFRTSNGEILIHQLESGKIAILVRHIGDYNETGDFVVPLMQSLSLDSNQLIVVQDNLRVDKLEIIHEPVAPINPDGNNAIFSINRNLAMALFPKLETLILNHKIFGPQVQSEDWSLLKENFFETAIDLSKSNVFRNSEAVAGPIRGFLSKVIKKQILRNLQNAVVDENRALRKQRGLMMKELKQPSSMTDAEKESLSQQIKDFDLKNANAFTQEKEKKIALTEAYTDLSESVEKLIIQNMSYQRLSMGTGAPDDGNFVDFVLGQFDSNVFNEDFFSKVANKLFDIIE